ncbi:MAG: DUF5698 domain-containing protein [Anaerolineae bacterium]|jgi:uncharacterized protein YebE (UPF0316 family)
MEVLLWSLIIFFARVTDVSLGTIRVQFIVRRKKLLAAAIGFVEVLIFILIVGRVIQDIQHWPYVLAYAGGFATGTLLGMVLSEKLSQRVVQTTVICNGIHEEMAAALREAGFALTRYEGTGRDGPVAVLEVVCTANRLPQLLKVVKATDPKAFFYTQELAALQGGYVLGFKSKLK